MQIGVRSTVIYNASDAILPAPIHRTSLQRSEKLTIGVVGELTRRKGVSDLPAIADKCSEADFFVYGSGPLEGILRGRPNVHLKGYEVDPGRIYSHIDVLLMLSYQEPFGRVATEAFSAMVPVIGRRSGALPEILIDELLFVDPSQVPEILERLRNAETRERIARSQQKKFLREFSREVFDQKMERELI